MLLGDFSARVASDHDSWSSCLDPHGIGSINENEQWLLELCALNELRINNSFSQSKAQQQGWWRHPRSKHWHQLDLIITRPCHLQNMCCSLAPTTALTATPTTLWSALKSDYNRRSCTGPGPQESCASTPTAPGP